MVLLHPVADELFVYVKMELQKRGFFLREFATLPRDLSTGSREMLLAFGWLMCKENIMQKFMQTCTSPLDDDTTALYLYQVCVGDWAWLLSVTDVQSTTFKSIKHNCKESQTTGAVVDSVCLDNIAKSIS